jgi:hypothetical protein
MYAFCVLLSTNAIGFIVIAAHAARGWAGVQRELMQPTAKLTKLNPSANF